MTQNLIRWFYGTTCMLLLLFFSATAQGASCDTIPGQFFYRDTFCSNQIILLNGHFYSPEMPSGVDTLPGAAANGGDSIIHVDLTFFSTAMGLLDGTICTGDTIWVNGVPYHANHYLGDEIIEGGAQNTCDSLVHIDLQVLPVAESVLSDSICPNDFLLLNGHRYDHDHPSGTEILAGAAANGCDSLVHIDLLFRDYCPSTAGFVYAPNVFKPESNEYLNGFFYLSADAGVAQIRRLIIVDRWGDLVFLRENFPPNMPDLGWDGKVRGQLGLPGMYGFRAEIELTDGKIIIQTGEMALIR